MTLLRFRPQRARGLAPLRRGGEPGHVALPALGEKLASAVAGAGNGVGGGEAHGVEAKRLGLVGDGLFQRLCHVAPSFRRKPESRVTCSEL